MKNELHQFPNELYRNIAKSTSPEMTKDKAKILANCFTEIGKQNHVMPDDKAKIFDRITQKVAKKNQEMIDGMSNNPLMTHKFEIDKIVQDLILYSDHEQQNAILFEIKRRLIENRQSKIQFNNDQSEKITKSIEDLQGIFNEKD